MPNDKKFTWADLKKIANELPEEFLNKEVTIWSDDDERGCKLTDCQILEEDHHYDGDGCSPKSILLEYIDDEEKENFDTEYPLIHKAGARILHAYFNH